MVKTDVLLQPINEAWLEQLNVTIMGLFKDLIQGYTRTGRTTVYYIRQEEKHKLIYIIGR